MLRNKTDTIVIKPKMSSVSRSLLVIIPVFLFVAAVAGAYQYGTRQKSAELERVRTELIELNDRYEFLNQRYVRIQASFVELKRQLSIDDSAYAQLRSELEQSNNQLAELTSELKFYRSIISPQEGKQGVRVQDITVVPTDQAGTFKYKLVLIQTLQQGQELTGTVRISIKGDSNGESRIIEHPEDGQEKLQVSFKYFQSLTGTFDLPDAFVPLEVRIDLNADKNKSLIDERWYPWGEIAAAQTS